jgi:putative transcription factor
MVSFCELCGKQTEDRRKVMVEGTEFNVCMACSKRGKQIKPNSSSNINNGKNTRNAERPIAKSTLTTSQLTSTRSISKQSPIYNRMKSIPKNKPLPQKKIDLTDEIILDPEFPKVIRDARNRKGMTHEQLGQKINEKVTLLKKIETGTIKPDEILSKKLEKFLGIKLYVNLNEET